MHFRTALTALPGSGAAVAAAGAALAAPDWTTRQGASVELVHELHRLQREVGLSCAPDVVEPFFARPFVGVPAAVVEVLMSSVDDPVVTRLPMAVGSVERWVHNTDVLINASRRVLAAQAWRARPQAST